MGLGYGAPTNFKTYSNMTTCAETRFEFYAHTNILQQSHCPSIRRTYFGWVLEVMLLCCFYLYFIEYEIVIEF